MRNKQENYYKSELYIAKKHIKYYLDGFNRTFIIAEFCILLGELLIAFLSIRGYLPYTIKVPKLANLDLKIYFAEKLFHQILTWLTIGIYFILYRHFNYFQKIILLIIESYILTIILAFGSWNVNYFGFLFIAPIIIAIPLGKQISRGILATSLILNSLYSIFQVTLREDYYNYVIGNVTFIGIITFYLLSVRIYKSMVMATDDLKNYYKLSTELSNEVAHDYLTKALSVAALHSDLDGDNNFKSCAFLDLDDFKSINDSKGHDLGDKILRLLVSLVQENGERIYRYGGDEFAILSELTAEKLAEKMEKIKKTFTKKSENLYLCPTTMSIGINTIKTDVKERLFEVLKNCDELMYVSKKSGKNKITVGA